MVRQIARNIKTSEFHYVTDEEANILTSIDVVKNLLYSNTRYLGPKIGFGGGTYMTATLNLSIGIVSVESVYNGEWVVFPDTPAGWILYGDGHGRVDPEQA